MLQLTDCDLESSRSGEPTCVAVSGRAFQWTIAIEKKEYMYFDSQWMLAVL